MTKIRSVSDEDFQVFVDTVHAAFGRFPEPAVEGGGQWWSALETDHCLLALASDSRPVGAAAAHSFELTLPGDILVPAAGVTAVGVLPSHRREGVLTAMMRHQLAELRSQGLFLAVLLASEAEIYGRFGYGPATYTAHLTVPRHKGALTAPRALAASAGGEDADSVTVVGREDCGEVLEDVYDQYRRRQPGALSRPRRWWALRAGQPPISPAPRYVAIHHDAQGNPDGYATYYLDESATLSVDEIITTDDAVFTALVRFALGHDLVSRIVFKHVPPGHPLRWQFADFRAGEVSGDTDWLWLRLLDVPRALSARSWFADGELVLDVEDPFLREHGRYWLTVQNGKVGCERTDRSPDLTLDVRDLGSIYLGGTAPSTLVRAGHIRAHSRHAAAHADMLFRGERTPHCLHRF